MDKEKIARVRGYYAENREKEIARVRRYYAENREKEIARKRRYRAENKEKIVASRSKYRAENKEKIAAQMGRYRVNASMNLTDAYIRRLLTSKSTLTVADVPIELIALKREDIKLKRLIKEKKDE